MRHRNDFMLNFIGATIFSYVIAMLILPIVLIGYAAFGPSGLGSYTQRQTLYEGKGDPWTPEEPFICRSFKGHGPFHCSQEDYLSYTVVGVIFGTPILILAGLFVLPYALYVHGVLILIGLAAAHLLTKDHDPDSTSVNGVS